MVDDIRIKFNASRLNKKISIAGEALTKQIKIDTAQYVPAQTLKLSGSTEIRNKNTELVYRTPYAHYQYIGLVRTDSRGRTFVNSGERKPILTNRPLKYNKSIHPKATSKWFEASKKAYLSKWISLVKDIIKNG